MLGLVPEQARDSVAVPDAKAGEGRPEAPGAVSAFADRRAMD
jgi:hypothetical protein